MLRRPKCHRYHRHHWNAMRICLRCGVPRNPRAGEKMFRVFVPKENRKAA